MNIDKRTSMRSKIRTEMSTEKMTDMTKEIRTEMKTQSRGSRYCMDSLTHGHDCDMGNYVITHC